MTNSAEMRAALEAVLFVASEPIPRSKLLEIFDEGERQAAGEALDDVIGRYGAEAAKGIIVEEVAGGFRLVTRPELHGYLRKFFEVTGRTKLSMAALETLAIVAYRQPVTGPEVQDYRGVNSSGVLKTLLERRLLKIAGRKKVVGKPFLYRTTREFLMHFGLESLEDLPPLEEIEDVFGTPQAPLELVIREGRVTVDGRVATVGDKADPSRQAIKVDGKRIRLPTLLRYFLLNKPAGYLSTRADPEQRRTVFELIPARWRKGLVTVGRLDFNTEGLLILTDDGDFAQRVAHPRYGCTKTYQVKVKGLPTEEQIDRLRKGVVVDGRRTAPAKIQVSKLPGGKKDQVNSWWTVELSEGRTRQIREMFFRIGHPVIRLRRIAIGPVSDRRLPAGSFRELQEDEVKKLLRGGRGVETGRRAVRKKRPVRKRS
jgi:23S rRNA pseudouridine2605 synthase